MMAIGSILAVVGMSCLMDDVTFNFGAVLSIIAIIILALGCL